MISIALPCTIATPVIITYAYMQASELQRALQSALLQRPPPPQAVVEARRERSGEVKKDGLQSIRLSHRQGITINATLKEIITQWNYCNGLSFS